MKICVVHQFYLMPGQSGGSRFNEMTRMWADRGHEVTVVAGTVDYNTGQVPARFRRKFVTEERDGSVRVLRCWVPPSYAKGYVGRALAFLGFQISACVAALQVSAPDVVVATSPPLIAAIPGWIAARLRGRNAPWIFEVRDLWPESAVSTGVLRERAALTRLLYRLEAWAYRSADKISVLTPAFRDDIVRRGLADSEKIVLIPNGADAARFAPGARENEMRVRFGWGDRFVVLYAGAHGRANALAQLVDAAELLRERPDILIACVGDGPERAGLVDEVERRGLTNIVFHGPQPKDDMPSIVNACDVGAAVLQRNETFKTVYPNKVFDYMVCERPTLLGIDGVARELVVESARAGIFVEPENARAISDGIVALAADPAECAAMGRRGRRYVLAELTRESLAEKYLNVMAALVRSRGEERR